MYRMYVKHPMNGCPASNTIQVQKKELDTNATSSSKPTKVVELLNPGAPKDNSIQPSSGAEADVESGGADDPEHIEASKAAKAFAQIPYGDYRASLQFLSANPSILTEKDSDGLLIEAFNSQLDGKEKYAKQCVHQALLIQYCRQLGGRDGVALFFKRITTKDHQANKLFTDDVQSTYLKIRTRAAEINREKEEEGAGVEQIQLHAVDPNTTINIRVPPPIDKTAAANPASQEDIASREIFESFPPNMQKALELGSLDEVNRVLGKMSVDEAEEVVAKLSEGGILSVEEGVVDATTEEGQRFVEEIERTGQLPGVSEEPPVD
jgi:cell division cycle protein 37